MKIECPLPPKILHPNSNPHYQSKANAVKKQRKASGEFAWLAAREMAEPLTRAFVTLHFHLPLARRGAKKRFHDPDNLIAWAKSTFDGLVDGGVFTDDKELVHLPPTQCHVDDLKTKLVVEVTKYTGPITIDPWPESEVK